MFKVKLVLPSDYPSSPPKGAQTPNLHSRNPRCTQHTALSDSESPSARALSGYFLTRIYHPNISKAGEICVNTLKKDWQSSLGIGHVLQVVRCLLINPFPESALNEEAGKDFMEDYDEYCKKARMYTEVHARASSKKADGAGGDEITEVSAAHRALCLICPLAARRLRVAVAVTAAAAWFRSRCCRVRHVCRTRGSRSRRSRSRSTRRRRRSGEPRRKSRSSGYNDAVEQPGCCARPSRGAARFGDGG